VLDEVRPREPHVVEAQETIVFTFSWPYIPVDEAAARSSHREELVRLRGLLLEDIADDYLSGVVEIDRGRTVTGCRSTLGTDPRDATVSFALGPRKIAYGQEAEALRNWAVQVRRHAREERERYARRRQELRRLREELARRRGPAA
jgi:hypothetical protein